jgi:precorrin-6A/cobalt-precorrin-6A reductase
MKILILGGTTEARQLAGELDTREGVKVTLSLAGRTTNPRAQGVPTRIGGFGGAEGLASFVRSEEIGLLIDATHPYADKISANAFRAAGETKVPFLALRRAPWEKHAGDDWTEAGSVTDAAQALGAKPARVFLTLGRKDIAPFAASPQHTYLIRSVDPIDPPLAVPDAIYVTARGPFGEAEDRALLEQHRIDIIVSKNSGGDASYGKIAAARSLAIPVVMVRRPALPDAPAAETIEDALGWCDHALTGAAMRGE